ncbi:MAG: hypothetical protein ABH864_05495 [archaeon]
MERKRFVALFVFSALLFVSFVSASQFDSVLLGAEDAIRFFLGDISHTGASPSEVFFVKMLVFVLLFVVVFQAMNRVPGFAGKTAMGIIISLIVSLIAIRYITTESLINFIWLPYGTLGIVLSVLIPFIIGFFFIQGFESSILRRVCWTAFLVIFLALGIMRRADLVTESGFNLGWIYIIIAAISGLLIYFDKEIRVMMLLSSMGQIDDVNKRVEAARITNTIDQDRELLARTTDPRSMDAIEKRIKMNRQKLKVILRS